MMNLVFLALVALVGACSDSTEDVELKLESDTYLRLNDEGSYGGDEFLYVSKRDDDEEKAIIKLPTGPSDDDEGTMEAIAQDIASSARGAFNGCGRVRLLDPVVLASSFARCGLITMFTLNFRIFNALFGCDASVVSASNLESSILRFHIVDNQNDDENTNIELVGLARQWYHTANWTQAHPFGSDGDWDTAGGDIIPNTYSVRGSVSEGVLSFDVTSHFRSIISSSESVHFGMVLRSSDDSLERVTLASSQHVNSDLRPSLLSTYNGECVDTSGIATPFSYRLGSNSFR